MFTLNFLNFYNLTNQDNYSDDRINTVDDNLFNYDPNNLEAATDISMLQNPFIPNLCIA